MQSTEPINLTTFFGLIVGTTLIAACAPWEPKEEPPLTLADVDYATKGVIKIVGQYSNADLNKEPRIVCEKRAPTGSNISKTFCVTREERRDMNISSIKTLEQFVDEYERRYFRRQDIK